MKDSQLFQDGDRVHIENSPLICRGNQINWFLYDNGLHLQGVKHSYLLTSKITPNSNNWGYFIKGRGNFINGWFIGDMEYFNIILEEYKVI